ncbi:FAD-binding oxidoreductase [Sinorhizobium sp. BG8]|uniref:FAD-binding oxidoreductase n=1 Tax=Sinorhizobium sp. BG8 TaxID=2613773 RepID=UPI00193D9B6E|nr:FAD-binding oxidoreductase [Sinorhizobium sp. BG8]
MNKIGTTVVLIGAEALSRRHPGEHPDNFGAGAMALPETAEGAAAVISWCADAGVPVVPQGGRTGLVGGSVSKPGEIILSSERLTQIELIDPVARIAVVQSGVTLQRLQEAAAPYGLAPGIDLAARGSATIGGMVSTNAGGILAFRNGVMRHQVLGIEAVLPDGRIFSDLTRVVKASAGPDMKQLLVGAEGAYGFVTRVVVKLETLSTARATALLAVPNAVAALTVVGHLQGVAAVTLEGAELMWRQYFLDSARVHDFDMQWLEGEIESILLVEISGESVERATAELERALEAVWEEAGLTGGIVAQSLDQARKFWSLREESEFIYRLHPNAPSFDVSIPPGAVDGYVATLRQRLASVGSGLDAYVYGHIADGNLHLSVIGDGADAAGNRAAVEDAVYTGITDLGGSFSAEHGVGTEKRDAYHLHGNPERRAVAQAIKAALDPKMIFNPGKVPF